ncbi:MAG: NADPH:quinone reductase [Planctomycetaceae bacterium]
MKAAFITQTGPPEVIRYDDLPDPAPGPGQVLVRVRAAAVNPIDTYIRAGIVPMPLEFPYIVGCDLAGVVEACGPRTTKFQPGDRVWGSNQGLFGRRGTFAELAAIDEQWLYSTPDEISDADAAAGALVGITAHLGLFLHAQLRPGELLFVNGGTGGVGSCVVQLAKAHGAKVIATVGSDEKKKQCEAYGADLVLDYHSSFLDDDIREFAEPLGGIDVWWETQREPTFDRTVGMMKKRGRIVLMAGRDARPEFPVGPFYVKDLKLAGFAMFNASPHEQQASADMLDRLYAEGTLRPNIGRTFPLSEAAAAHRLQEEATVARKAELNGKIVVEP